MCTLLYYKTKIYTVGLKEERKKVSKVEILIFIEASGKGKLF